MTHKEPKMQDSLITILLKNVNWLCTISNHMYRCCEPLLSVYLP